jgi:hypothetical protein
MRVDHLESTDGEVTTFEDWTAMFDTVMEAEGVVESLPPASTPRTR